MLGSTVLSTPWHAPVFCATLDVAKVGQLKDQRHGAGIVFPASGYIAMAVQAAYQIFHGHQHSNEASSIVKLGYLLHNVRFVKLLVLEQGRTESSC
jgi:hypothetical protein